MLANELRQKYIEFFKSKEHLYLPSAPLVPIDILGNEDKTVLFTGSGMQQFKPYFVGAAVPPSRRITTVQKCLRTVDIDSVGDYSHCTFFEMLGNFSFGDYFKAEVIPWTWEFLTEWLKLNPERFCVTVYLDDDEAFTIWHRMVGIPEDRIHRLDEDKNYWPANAITEGPNGPCGPCTEIYYRVAPPEEMNSDPTLTPTERFKIDDAAGRYVEVWNNVFTQYERSEDEHGKAILTPLPQKNNDTGAGFDRLVMVVQDKGSVFETDLFSPILEKIEELSGVKYGGTMDPADFALRVVAEHVRSMVFCIADGILPGNEDREYILRYIIRRAIRYGKKELGFDRPFLHEVAPKVIEQMGDFYTELRERRELILKTIQGEEERFLRTLDNGMRKLEEMFESESVKELGVLSGEDAFMLHDTFGFPLDLTRDIAAERGVNVDTAGFEQAMADQRERSRQASGMGKEVFTVGAVGSALTILPPTEFLGYGQVTAEATILAIYDRERRSLEFARPGEEVEIVLDRTPFYAEAGGQVGDTGLLTAPAGDTTCALKIEVTDTQKREGVYFHSARVLEGEASVGQTVHAAVDVERRRHIMRNHTATHLLQAALRTVLGSHVHQKGSLVAPDRLRFDFTHNQPMTPDEIRRVEDIVNEHILADTLVVVHSDVPIAEAKQRGAMALFGEKYGDRVRMIEVPGFSLELCGGTHLSHTSQVGLFEIISETGVAAGVRRIEAVTGAGAYAYVRRQEAMLGEIASLLKANPSDAVTAVERLIEQRRELERQNRQLKASGGAAQAVDLTPQDVHGIPVIVRRVDGADAEALANLADRAAQQHHSAVIVLGTANDGKVSLTAKVSKDLVEKGLHAGNLVREVARITGGGGGGRPDFAQAGGRDPNKLQEALDAVPQLIEAQRKKG
ncbi:MAG TPA: alanine--tRNA ligase [Chthonomonadaceae bacterium]|nr:alanine--tRNA ligase [Chthonomonadaceae bacterium]